MVLMLEGMFRLPKALHCENILSLKESRDASRLTSFKEEQLLNAYLPTLLTVEGSVNEESELPSKANSPMAVSPSLRVTMFRVVLAKAPSAMVFTEAGKVKSLPGLFTI